jgi:hypothetical protein
MSFAWPRASIRTASAKSSSGEPSTSDFPNSAGSSARSNGPPSKTPPAESKVLIVLAVLGTLLSLGLICGSIALNFRMAYRSADTVIDAWIYGISIGLGDALKALMPFVVARALAQRNWLAVGAGAAFFAIMSVYSFTAAVGFAAQHRLTKSVERLGSAERYHDLRQRYATLAEMRKDLGQPRAPAIIREQRNVLLLTPIPGKQTIGELSANCTLNRADAQAVCEQWRKLGVELATSLEAERIDGELLSLRDKLDQAPAVESGEDPQTVALSRLGRWFARTFPQEDIQLGLSLLLALVIELGSGFGLFLAASLRGHTQEEGERVAGEEAQQLGTAGDYAEARLEPEPGATLTTDMLYQDYMSWCRSTGRVPLRREPFLREFARLAAEVGMRVLGENGYGDVAVIGENAPLR